MDARETAALDHDFYSELLPARALDSLDPGEAELLARHLPGCPSCLDELAEFERVAGALALAAPDAAPSPELRGRLLGRVAAQEQRAAQTQRAAQEQRARPESGGSRVAPTPRRLGTRRAWPAYAVMALAAIILGGLLWAAAGRLASDGRLVDLGPTELAPEAAGELRFSRDGRAATLEVFRLPALAEGQAYQLWLVAGDDDRDSGALFSVNDNGWAEVPVEMARPSATYHRFGVTIEPEGGSPGPTGEPVLRGEY